MRGAAPHPSNPPAYYGRAHPSYPPQPVENTGTGSRRRRGPDPMLLGAIAGIATVFAIGLGTLMGLVLLLVLNRPNTSAPPPRVAVVAPPALASAPAPAPTPTPAAAAAAPAARVPGGGEVSTIAAVQIQGRPSAGRDPVAIMLSDLRYERQLERQAIHRPEPVAEESPPPSIVSGLWRMIMRMIGFGDEPGLEPDGQPIVIPIEPSLPRHAPVPVAPEPVAAPAPEPLLEPIASRDPVPRLARLDARAASRPAPAPASTPSSGRPRPIDPPPAPLERVEMPTGPIEFGDDDLDAELLEETFDAADLFIAPGGEEDEGPDQSEVEALDDMGQLLLQVQIDVDDIPMRVDGKEIGTVPGAFQVAPGSHEVQLYFKGGFTNFVIEANDDPETWCFERKGKAFRQVRCS